MRTIFLKSGLATRPTLPPISSKRTTTKFATLYKRPKRACSMPSPPSSPRPASHLRISVLIVACSMFSPSLPLCFIVNHFNFDPSIKTYNLSGMGCSGGTMCCDLPQRSYAASRVRSHRRHREHELELVLRREPPDARHQLHLPRRHRGHAPDQRPNRRCSAKMELVRALRTHHGAEDAAYNAAVQMEDEDGSVGMSLSKDLVRVAGPSCAATSPRWRRTCSLCRSSCGMRGTL
uniref:FAE domain-containing protein n=1 Tax=Ananas comosus var. bracteatus TaxID=296719 RepID=A0A6V7PT88_ANACO|nr:unnamed protein product [Ananas comosus var. bracteatus]